MLKITLFVIVFLTSGEKTTLVKQFDNMEQCQTVAKELSDEMIKMDTIKDAIFVCTNKIKPTEAPDGITA